MAEFLSFVALVKVKIHLAATAADGMSLQTYTANFQPGTHTTALSVVHINTDFFLKMQMEDFCFFRRAALV